MSWSLYFFLGIPARLRHEIPLLSMSQIPDLACLGGLGCGQGQGPSQVALCLASPFLVQTNLIEKKAGETRSPNPVACACTQLLKIKSPNCGSSITGTESALSVASNGSGPQTHFDSCMTMSSGLHPDNSCSKCYNYPHFTDEKTEA